MLIVVCCILFLLVVAGWHINRCTHRIANAHRFNHVYNAVYRILGDDDEDFETIMHQLPYYGCLDATEREVKQVLNKMRTQEIIIYSGGKKGFYHL